jgi:hypothetical protein
MMFLCERCGCRCKGDPSRGYPVCPRCNGPVSVAASQADELLRLGLRPEELPEVHYVQGPAAPAAAGQGLMRCANCMIHLRANGPVPSGMAEVCPRCGRGGLLMASAMAVNLLANIANVLSVRHVPSSSLVTATVQTVPPPPLPPPTCGICENRPPDYVIRCTNKCRYPICQTCAAELHRRGHGCPTCREPVW